MSHLRSVTPADVKKAIEIEAAWRTIREAEFDHHVDEALELLDDDNDEAA